MRQISEAPPVIGIVANPASGHDIRRLTSGASVYSAADKVNCVERLLGALGATGVTRVLMMPDRAGIAVRLRKAVELNRRRGNARWPRVDFIDMPVLEDDRDTVRAVREMRAAGVAMIVVLGGDGTHRAVALASGDIPLATLSTGTNNAFPALGEATVVGLAAGLAITGRVKPACIHNKCLRVTHPGGESMALVDVGVMPAEHIGARAVYAADAVEAVFAAFAEPDAIGLSAIAAACGPVARTAPFGRWVRRGAGTARLAAISPGLVQAVEIAASGLMQPGIAFELGTQPAILALDGEPEIVLDGRGPASVLLALDGPITLDVAATLAAAHAADALVVTAGPEPALRDSPPAAPGQTGADHTIAPA